MDEETTTQKTEVETAAGDTGEGDKPEAKSLIDTAHAENERMEKLLKELKEENNRREEIAAKQMLGGTTEAGKPQEKKEESDHDYRTRVEKEINAGTFK